MNVNGENRTSMAMLAIAVVCLILASVFSPQIGAEAKTDTPAAYSIEDVSGWLFRLASWLPAEGVPEHARCSEAVPPAGFWEL